MSSRVFIVFIAIKLLLVSGQNPEQTFFIGKDGVNYTSAVQRCKLMNARLVVINNQNVQNQLQEEIQKLPKQNYSSFWIGLTKSSSSTSFQWINNNTSNYRNWANDEGHSITENCVILGHPVYTRENFITRSFQWFSINCNGDTGSENSLPSYICQSDKGDQVSSTPGYVFTTSSIIIHSTTKPTISTLPTTTQNFNVTQTTKYISIYELSTSTGFMTSMNLTTDDETSIASSDHATTLYYYVIPGVISLLLLILLVVVIIRYKRKRRPRTRSIGKIKVQAKNSIYHSTTVNYVREYMYTDNPDDSSTCSHDYSYKDVEEDIYQSTHSLDNSREFDQNETTNSYDDDHTRPYESVSSMELVDGKKINKRHYYSNVKRSKKQASRIPLKILIENEKATYAEITDSVPQTNLPENKPDAEPYVSVEEMEALSGNLSPIRISREVSLKHQTIGEVYNATNRS